ncbi:MAG: hypothetical protein ACYDCL_17820 [Myxococcales bacterium]
MRSFERIEANVLTQPHGLVSAEEAYLAGALPDAERQVSAELPHSTDVSWAW